MSDQAKPQSLKTMSDGQAPITSKFEYDETPYLGDKSFATPTNTNMYNRMRPGQVAIGTNVYNPQPSDIEQERIFGERRYKEKVDPESIHVVRQKMHDQAQEIEKMQAMIAAFLAAQSGVKPAEPVVEVVPEPEPVEPQASNVAKRKPSKPRRKR